MVDDQEFEDVWRAFGPSVLRYCRFAVGSAELGEDIASETFARFLQRGDGIAKDKVEAWLFTVARNQARSHQRRNRLWLAVMPILVPPVLVEIDPLESLSLNEMLKPLSTNERLAIYLRVIEARPFADVALMTGKSEAGAKKTVYRALRRLRALAEEDRERVSRYGGIENG